MYKPYSSLVMQMDFIDSADGPPITGPPTNKHILALNVSDPFFRERIMSHGHHFSIRM